MKSVRDSTRQLRRVGGVYGLNVSGCVYVCSWAAGSNPWGQEQDNQFMRPTHYDGMLEVVGVTGVIHMGQIQSGMRTAIRIAQGGHVRALFLRIGTISLDDVTIGL